MPIEMLKPSEGLKGTKLAKAAVGFMTGGPIGAVMALAAANNPKLKTVVDVAGAVGGKGAPDPASNASQEAALPDLGSQFQGQAPTLGDDNPMARRYSVVPEGALDLQKQFDWKPDLSVPEAPVDRVPAETNATMENPLARRFNLPPSPEDHAAIIEEGLAAARGLADSHPDIYGQLLQDGAIHGLLQGKHFGVPGRQRGRLA